MIALQLLDFRTDSLDTLGGLLGLRAQRAHLGIRVARDAVQPIDLFLQGVAAYRDGKYYEAVAIFLQTQRIYPDTQLCFNIARAYENLGNASAALRYYRDYLRQADRPSDGDEVRALVHELEQQLSQRGVQQLSVLSQPDSATVLLDGKPVGITPWTGETYPGKHRLALTLVHASPEGDIVFPPIDPKVWREVERREQPRGPEDDCGFAFVTYVRSGAA